jgi:hypothetical protein
VNHDRRSPPEPLESRPEIVVAEAVPGLLLHSADHAERSQVPGLLRIVEVSHDGQLEHPSLKGLGILDAQVAFAKPLPLRLDLGCQISLRESPLEVVPCGAPRGGRAHQREPLDPVRVLGGVELSQQPAPGIAQDRKPILGPELA